MSNTQKQLEEIFLLAAFLLESQNYKFFTQMRDKTPFLCLLCKASLPYT